MAQAEDIPQPEALTTEMASEEEWEGSRLLWRLADGDEGAFVNYLRTFPDPIFQNLLEDPVRLSQTIERLQEDMPLEEEPQESEGGIPEAPLQSSNIYGFHYDPDRRIMLVRFQGGRTYGYSGVPQGVFRAFQRGAVPARTSGQNRHGRWWTGKIPSLGAAFYRLIREGGYPYRQLN